MTDDHAQTAQPLADVDHAQTSGTESLQQAFLKFREQKLRALRNETFNKPSPPGQRSEEFMQRLRQRFIATAKSYFGVPYARRYHEPGTEMYNAPLFLDCCGLVRQCVNDLKEEFGFTLGRWNQAYQFDTLPLRKSSHEELQPGDLIFYAATYYNPRARRQRHDMVHVEIFIGGSTGEQSIGSRWQTGSVQMFDSYKFVSKLYYDVKHYYCSIDTWLQGVCKSFCPEHDWRRLTWVPGSRSIFSVDDAMEDGYEEDEGEPTAGGSTATATVAAAAAAAGALIDFKHAAESDAPIDESVPVFFATGNGSKTVSEHLLKEGWAPLAKQFASSTRYTLKWTERAAEIDMNSFRPGEQLANHIGGIHHLTSSPHLLAALRRRAAAELGALPTPGIGPTAPATAREGDGDSTAAAAAAAAVSVESASAAPGEMVPPPPMVPALNCGGALLVPELYRLDSTADALVFCEVAERQKGSLWMIKPIAHRGFRARLTRDIDAIRSKYVRPTYADAAADAAPAYAQRYVHPPLLLHGCKLDVRFFLLIASTRPWLVLAAPGYARKCAVPYDWRDTELALAHRASLAVQRRAGPLDPTDGGHTLRLETLAARLEAEQAGRGAQFLLACQDRIPAALRYAVEAVRPELAAVAGVFQLLACDFTFDADLQPWLFEITAHPSYGSETEPMRDSAAPLLREALDIVIHVHRTRAAGCVLDALPTRKFSVIASE